MSGQLQAGRVHLSRGRRQRRAALVVTAVVLSGPAVSAGRTAAARATRSTASATAGAGVWPSAGQAAYSTGGAVVAKPGSRLAPIASVAKVMTAYVVLLDHPLRGLDPGPTIVVNDAEAAEATARRAAGESGVPLEVGERLTEREALQALLLPSANDVAVVLARWDAGSQPAFVAEENREARSLGLSATTYTDPSGLDPRTVSTAADQVVLLDHAFDEPVFTEIVAEQSADIPVAGVVTSTDTLLGRDGFVGGKTGSTEASGGCFVFRDLRQIHGRRVVITGAVLGQPGPGLISSALRAAQAMTDALAQAG